MTDVSVSLRAKRKRGRPRKDSNLCREGSSLQSPENSTLLKTQVVDQNSKDGSVDVGLVGRVVYGVIEGSFDAGYLISVRIGNNHTPFRGVVFQPKKLVPITAANDVAPQAKMYHRREIPLPVYDNVTQTTSGFSPHSPPERATLQPFQASKQAVLRPVLPSTPLSVPPYSSSNHSSFMVSEAMMMRTSSCSNMGLGGQITVPKSPNSEVCKQFPYIHPTGSSLRMVEEDEVMQAFEVSTSSGGSKNIIATGGDLISESLPKAINQEHQVHGKAVESELGMITLSHNKSQGSGSNVQLHHNLMEDMPRSAFEIQQDEMICREMEHPRSFVHNGLQSSTIELQETPAVAQPQAKTQMQPMYYSELRSSDVNFHQNLFTDQSHQSDFVDSVSKSPNLKLDLAFTVHEKKPLPPEPQATSDETNYSVLNGMRNPNFGYHQALVAGNPLLLPPDLIGEPLEFMMEKPKSPSNCKTPQETNSEAGERFNGENAASPSASYKLELATPQSALNTDMDFVLSESIQPTESHSHRSSPSEREHR